MRSRFACAVLLMTACANAASADVVISNHQTQNMSCSAGVCAPTASDAVLNVGDLENLLAAGGISVATTNGSVEASNIAVTAPFTWRAASSLAFDAYLSITFSADVQVKGSGAVSLVTNDGGSGGALIFAIGKGSLHFAQTKTKLMINGTQYKLASTIKELAAAIAAKPDGSFALASDYDASTDGTYATSPVPTPFSGSFNGLGHAIAKLEIVDGNSIDYVGLFSSVTNSGSIASVTIAGANVTAVQTAGILTGVNQGTISNSSTDGHVKGREVGGLTGKNYGTIAISRSAATVRSKYCGGGLVCLVDRGTIVQSFASGQVWGRYFAGGLVGSIGGPFTIKNSYALGDASGTDKGSPSIGGFVAYNYQGSVTTSYSIGAVKATRSETPIIGGFDGYNFGTISNSYWDTETSGQDQGSGNGNDTGLTGLTTEQFQSGLPDGFDPAIWAEDANINNGFPYLIANPPPQGRVPLIRRAFARHLLPQGEKAPIGEARTLSPN